MAQTKKTNAKTRTRVGGPFLATAVFCDSVVHGDDGAMTAVRIVDHVTITIPSDAPPEVPSSDKALLANLEGLVSFKKGDSGQSHALKLVMNAPSGEKQVVAEREIEFKNEMHGGFNLRMNATIAITQNGLFWLDVLLDGKLMTRVPLLVTVKRAQPKVAKEQKKKGRKKK